MSMGKLRGQFEVARTLGLVEASPRRGIIRTEYDFLPAVRLSLTVALAIDPCYFDAFSSMRAHRESAYWDEAVVLLSAADKERLAELVRSAWQKLSQPRIQIPFQEHRELHLTIYRRLNNPFVVALAGSLLGCLRGGGTEHLRRSGLSASGLALPRTDRGSHLRR